jgi:hypothetical protein
VKLAAALPKGEGNGLAPILAALLNDPHRVHVVVALVDCKSTQIEHETGDRRPTMRVKRIEAITGDDLKLARRLLERAYEERLGAATLPFELEEDVRSAFPDDDGGDA